MSDDGYTLVEMLVAMLIIGLAIGGVAESTRVLGLIQSRTVHSADAAMSTHAAEAALDALFNDHGPFPSDVATGLAGQPRRLTFPCQGGVCRAAIRDVPQGSALDLNLPHGAAKQVLLTSLRRLSFNYVDAKGTGAMWPPVNPKDWRLLRAVSITDGTGSANPPLALTRLWLEQEPGCSSANACGVTP